ncbi:MAG: hypothetical protein IJK52_08985 [Oscillospiraceae bacterium]|nr:hypothetical protein [Oscillospiraceae bacterium]
MEQAEIRRLSKLFGLERRIQSARTCLPAKREYDLTRQNTPARLLRADSLRILYDRLREYTAFSGCGCQDSPELRRWIPGETASLYPTRDNLQKPIRRLRGRLPDLPAFLSFVSVSRERGKRPEE